MHYYFNLLDGSEVICDTEGVEGADLGQAHAEAIETLHAPAREVEAAAATWSEWRLDVLDTSGVLLFAFGLDRAGAVH
jgi:hypothetical protein